ncbi:uroporphyrinogen-III C-methyltransferase [Ktedonosporobacter rubrisoli]|uniref:uroporphyrinogen-III C-methyltransferase n=1 Tax=Ktedonosporobacter rubrisoli TaxID=2509675 RepID=A0A4P6K0K2_KTERU|nr:uroporphyrinogen-III C-methyltransferase [Ktedonosporobacter rubrisoli]QBD81579.1 uroporphyrinogen-III C-methyltransferase [Ktedonosporobacter rubrisoli]
MSTLIHYRRPANSGNNEPSPRGKVFLVGAGPGDPDLITVKGLRCLHMADVVLYDRLVSPALLEETRPGVLRIYVGKGPQKHAMEQTDINTLLITYAQQGRIVVRLKGGDPFLFGRGGEEAEALANAGIPFEIVPGVSSSIAVPAYAGIPLTHRNYTSTVTIVTGHAGYTSPGVNWEALAQLKGTLVVLMGVKALPQFTQHLIEGGLTPDTPAAVIQEGTTAQQRIITGELATIARQASEAGLSSPALTVIGHVVNLHELLSWYEAVSSDATFNNALVV